MDNRNRESFILLLYQISYVSMDSDSDNDEDLDTFARSVICLMEIQDCKSWG